MEYSSVTAKQGQGAIGGFLIKVAARDPEWTTLRRAARAALVMPAAFFVSMRLVDNRAFSLFVAFGCLSSLLLVGFSGARNRQLAEAGGMFLASTTLVLLGTIVSGVIWLRVLSMAAVAFVAFFLSMLKPSLTKMISPILVAFILAITVAPASLAIPERLLAWSMAGTVSLLAILCLWPVREITGAVEPALRDAFRTFAAERKTQPNRYVKPLRHAIRTAIAMGAAVLVADVIKVQHAFWVILGTVVVLCSNAIGTGQNAIRAIVGTEIGMAIAGALIAFLGTNTAVFWILLPIAILFTGFASGKKSFVAGQAGFTVLLLLISNLTNPVGWTVGLIRLEDIALGCAISACVGIVFWPHEPAPLLSPSK